MGKWYWMETMENLHVFVYYFFCGLEVNVLIMHDVNPHGQYLVLCEKISMWYEGMLKMSISYLSQQVL